MANMRMAKKSSSPICSSGTMAFMMDLSTTCKPRVREQQGKLECKRGSINEGVLNSERPCGQSGVHRSESGEKEGGGCWETELGTGNGHGQEREKRIQCLKRAENPKDKRK